MESAEQTTFHPTAITLGHSEKPLSFTDVYIDDFMVVAQCPLHIPSLNHLLHTIDTVFSDPKPTKRRQIVSQSKLQQGETPLGVGRRYVPDDATATTSLLSPNT
jgi:hypothetical protein